MKIVLLKETSGLGKEGDLLEVADGHARNYLIPKGFALRATAGIERQSETTRKTRELKESKDLETAKEIAGRLTPVTLKIATQASPEGKLYGAVSPADIVATIEEQEKITLDKSSVNLPASIKELGSFKIPISLHDEVSFELTAEITAAQ